MFSFSKIYLPYSRRTIHDITRLGPMSRRIVPAIRTATRIMAIAGSATKRNAARSAANTAAHTMLENSERRGIPVPMRT